MKTQKSNRKNMQVPATLYNTRKKKILAESIRLPLHTTVFQAEIIAINEACKAFLDKRQPNMQFIKILSDSQAALQALNSSIVSSSLVKETITNLNMLA